MRVRQFLRDTKGASAAEMALVLPLLLVLMFGPFELAHYFWTEHKVVKGVRDGARYASRLGFTNYTCSDLTNSHAQDSGAGNHPHRPGIGRRYRCSRLGK